MTFSKRPGEDQSQSLMVFHTRCTNTARGSGRETEAAERGMEEKLSGRKLASC